MIKYGNFYLIRFLSFFLPFFHFGTGSTVIIYPSITAANNIGQYATSDYRAYKTASGHKFANTSVTNASNITDGNGASININKIKSLYTTQLVPSLDPQVWEDFYNNVPESKDPRATGSNGAASSWSGISNKFNDVNDSEIKR